ncbi:MAG: rhomboid family intramembrane serine protease [Bacteroidia bacterium]
MFQHLLRNLTPVVKNLVIINALFYLAQLLLPSFTEQFALYYFESDKFKLYQIATHFFMHSPDTFLHILFNMFALIMFGPPLERIWNAQKFLLFYFISAFGALFVHQAVMYFQVQELNELLMVYEEGSMEYYETLRSLKSIVFTPMLGASGAIFGVLAAFAFYFPNTQLMLLFPPIPIKAKWLVLILVGFDLFMGIGNHSGDNVAHFAHLGGALFGFIMVLLWQKNRSDFY